MPEERCGMSRTPADAAADIETRRREVIDQIAALGPPMPGSLVMRSSRCGHTGCACRADPPRLHGPYPVWTRSINGETITRSLKPEQADRYQAWFDNTQRLRELVDELKQLALEQAQLDEHWPQG